jgi:hypothetical protein
MESNPPELLSMESWLVTVVTRLCVDRLRSVREEPCIKIYLSHRLLCSVGWQGVAGGKDNGLPGIRPHYHPNYYAAFVIGPDGHNIEAVCHRPEA